MGAPGATTAPSTAARGSPRRSSGASSTTPTLNALEREFLDASDARAAGGSGARRGMRIAFAGLIVALAAITAVAIVALYQGREAERQRDIAVSGELGGDGDELPRRRSRPQRCARASGAGPAVHRTDGGVLRQATYDAPGTGVWQLHDGG